MTNVAGTAQSMISRILSDRRAYPVGVFTLALVVRLGYLSRILQGSYGVRTPPDTNAFLQSCDVLFSEPTAIFAQTKGLQYLGFTIPFCTVDRLTGGSGLAWVVLQIGLSAVTAVLVYYTATYLSNRAAGVVAGVAFALLFDTLRFTVFLLSETTFTFMLVLSIWALVRYRTKPTRFAQVLVLASLGWLAITRPFGPPIVAGWVLLEVLPRDSKFRTGFLPRPVAVATVLTIPIALALFSGAAGKLVTMERGWREGWIMYNGKSTFFLREYAYAPRTAGSLLEFVVFNLDHVVIMGILRTLVFFVPLIGGAGFSPFWTGLNILVLGPLIVLGLYGLFRARKSNRTLLAVLGVPLLVIVGITAVTYVSLSWRYRAPLGPVLAIATGYIVASETTIPDRIASALGL